MSDLELAQLIERLNAKQENAYGSYIGIHRKDECLGWEGKVEQGKFGVNELQAHKDAQEQLGKHRAFNEVIEILNQLAQTKDKE